MLRVVLDTNVIVAAAASRRGAGFRLLQLLRDGRYVIAMSPALALEYEEVLKRESDRIEWTDAEVSQFVDWINTKAEHFDALFRLRPMLRDSDDESLLELTFTAQVDCLVTYNVGDFAGSERVGVGVVTPSVFLSLVLGGQS